MAKSVGVWVRSLVLRIICCASCVGEQLCLSGLQLSPLHRVETLQARSSDQGLAHCRQQPGLLTAASANSFLPWDSEPTVPSGEMFFWSSFNCVCVCV